jgi:hypothetical protein
LLRGRFHHPDARGSITQEKNTEVYDWLGREGSRTARVPEEVRSFHINEARMAAIAIPDVSTQTVDMRRLSASGVWSTGLKYALQTIITIGR